MVLNQQPDHYYHYNYGLRKCLKHSKETFLLHKTLGLVPTIDAKSELKLFS